MFHKPGPDRVKESIKCWEPAKRMKAELGGRLGGDIFR